LRGGFGWSKDYYNHELAGPKDWGKEKENKEVENSNESYTTIVMNDSGIFSSLGHLSMFVNLLFRCFCGIVSPFHFYIGVVCIPISFFSSYDWMG